jgi:hypothetical protein
MIDLDHAALEAEARERWGDTDAYRESARRARRYGKEEWAKIRGAQEGIETGLADAMISGDPAEGERARHLAEQARLHIDRWFYPCSHRMHVGLAEMYIADPRFKAHYDDRARGLAEYVAAAIRANAAAAPG